MRGTAPGGKDGTRKEKRENGSREEEVLDRSEHRRWPVVATVDWPPDLGPVVQQEEAHGPQQERGDQGRREQGRGASAGRGERGNRLPQVGQVRGQARQVRGQARQQRVQVRGRLQIVCGRGFKCGGGHQGQ